MENQSVLNKYKRQPKIYLVLPSGGAFYPSNPMEKTGSGELPIYSMTAKDALMSGEATVDVIKSCCPLIDDPWSMPSIDLDAILIAIRIATYGEKMELQIPIRYYEEGDLKVGSETIEIDLRTILDKMQGKTWNSIITHGDLKFHVKPLSYKETTSFFNQRLSQVMQDTKIDEAQKLQAFKEGFKKLSQMTLDMVITNVTEIETPEGTESNIQAIKQFFETTDKHTFTAVQKGLEHLKAYWSTPNTRFQVPADYVEKGAESVIDVPMVFDNASFFA